MLSNFNLSSFTLQELKDIDKNIGIIKGTALSDTQILTLPGSPSIRLYCGNDTLYLDIVLFPLNTLKPCLISVYSDEGKDTVKKLATNFLTFL